jgi:hypothetical protein
VKSYRCPTCKRDAKQDGNKVFPFCSERCQLIDLGRWLSEEYRVPDEADASGGGVERASDGRDDES